MNIGIIGFGFMGRTHLNGYAADPRATIVAIADARPVDDLHSGGNIAGSEVDSDSLKAIRRESDPKAILDDPEIDAVSICVPTHLHAALAVAAIEAGKHVLLEKPAARTAHEARTIHEALDRHPRLFCMPAMCMRFWPGWSWLRQTIQSGTLGSVRSAVFTRHGALPSWGREFYADKALSGGAMLDLHIHDADFVRFCFGDPNSVFAQGSIGPSGGIDHVISHYHFADGPALVMAEGAWMSAPAYPFAMRYRVNFDDATAEFDSGRDKPLILHDADGSASPVELPAGSGYEMEIRHFLDSVEHSTPSDIVALADGIRALDLVEAEAKSIQIHQPVPFA